LFAVAVVGNVVSEECKEGGCELAGVLLGVEFFRSPPNSNDGLLLVPVPSPLSLLPRETLYGARFEVEPVLFNVAKTNSRGPSVVELAVCEAAAVIAGLLFELKLKFPVPVTLGCDCCGCCCVLFEAVLLLSLLARMSSFK
jgi:hypothetical protein